MEVEPGLRVIKINDSEGYYGAGDCYAGTIINIAREIKQVTSNESSPAPSAGTKTWNVTVFWDIGKTEICSFSDNQDPGTFLRVFDNSAVAGQGGVNSTIICSSCPSNENQIIGMRWHCAVCSNLYLCTDCYMSGKHDMEHEFERINSAGCSG